MAEDLLAKLRRNLEERRAKMTPEQRAAEDRRMEERERQRAAAEAFWAAHREGLPDTPEGCWQANARAFAALNMHDFFSGTGPLLVETIGPKTSDDPSEERSRVFTTREHTPTMSRMLEVLRDAIQAAGLTGKIQLTMHETNIPERPPYIHAHLSFTEWNLVPDLLREDLLQQRRVGLFGLEEPGFLSDVLDPVRGGADRIEGVVRCLLIEPEHPLTPHLFAAMRAAPGEALPVWAAWARLKFEPGSRYGWPTPTYDEIPCWPSQTFDVGTTVVDLLDKGVVVLWPPTGERVRVRLDRHEDINPEQWQFNPEGDRVLHIECTDEALTPVAPGKRAPGQERLQVFGRGSSQQDPRIPTVPEHTTICLMSWTDPADFTITVLVSVDAKGRPAFAWADTSAT